MIMSFCFNFLSSSSRIFSRSLFFCPSSLAWRESCSSWSCRERQLGHGACCACETCGSAREGGWVGVRAVLCWVTVGDECVSVALVW